MSTKLWYDHYVNDWMWALPLGNGRLGAMVYGNPDKEQIQINEESLWSGSQFEEKYHATPEALAEIRELIFNERLQEAAELCRKNFLSDPPSVRFYESFGEIFIDFFDKTPYINYHKELELSDAVSKVSWIKGLTEYQSESFVSEKYDCFVYHVTANNAFSCNVTMKRKQDAYTASASTDTLILRGRVTYADEKKYGPAGEGMSFGAKLRVRTDGTLKLYHDSITVMNATYLTVIGAYETNYNVHTFDIDESIDYKGKLDRCIDAVANVPYEQIKAEHIEEHHKWFSAMSLELDAPSLSNLPTDRRLKLFKRGQRDDDLYSLYFNFGRYLLIESSGKNATLPANLQGIWCQDFRPAWGSDYHTNINVQMNYWAADSINCSDAYSPFTHFVKMMSKFGVRSAKELFNAGGWMVNHTTDVFGKTGIHDNVDCGFYPMGGPWLCLNLWDHYEYTNDADYLKEIFPILKGCCEFVCDYLVEAPDGYLTTCPSNSPENKFKYLDGNGKEAESMLTHGATTDFEIIYALFTRMIHACKLLNEPQLEDKLSEVLKRLPPIRISERYGTICEWIKDYEETEPGHRHYSHMFGLHPGDQINETNPALYEAAKKTLQRRIAHGGGAHGWSRAWLAIFFTRLKNSQEALTHLRLLLSLCTANNLFDICPPFQIDGNFGGVACIIEMLVQSHLGSPDDRIIELLPALPDDWSAGSIKGLKVRGGFTLDFEWKNRTVTKLCITSNSTNTFKLKLHDNMIPVKTNKKYIQNDSILEFSMLSGELIEIDFE